MSFFCINIYVCVCVCIYIYNVYIHIHIYRHIYSWPLNNMGVRGADLLSGRIISDMTLQLAHCQPPQVQPKLNRVGLQYIFMEKNPSINGPAQFKPVLFRVQCTFLKSSFRFTTKLSAKYREFPQTLFSPLSPTAYLFYCRKTEPNRFIQLF